MGETMVKPVKTEIWGWGVKFTFANGSYCNKYYDGKEYWYNANGKCHRGNDQPAIIRADGTKEWRLHGSWHRGNDQPAIIHADGTKEWWVNGKRIKTRKAGQQ